MKSFKQLILSVLVIFLSIVDVRATDMCYDSPTSSGGILCLGFLDVGGCKLTTPIRNISSFTLTDVTVIKAYEGINLSLMSGIGIDGTSKTPNIDSDSAEVTSTLNQYTNFNGFVDFNIFDKGVVYRTDDYAPSSSTSTTDQHTIYTQALVGFSFSSVKYIAEYTKGGTVYNTRLYPCGQELVSITPQNQSIAEGDVGTTAADFTVTLSSTPTANKLYVAYTITPQTATQGTDYSASSYSGTLTFNKNTPTLSQTISTSVIADDINESNETYVISLTSLSQAASENFIIDESFQKGTVTIIDDDNGSGGVVNPPVVIIGDMDVIENTSYTTAGSYAAANKNIFTKIVKKPFNLEAVYLDENRAEKLYDGDIGNKIVNMAVMLYTTDETCTQEDQFIWGGQMAHNSSHVTAVMDDFDADDADEEEGFTIQKASKRRKIKANFIDYGTLIKNTSDLNCAASSLDSSLCLVPACMNSDDQILKAFPVAQYPYVTTCLNGDGTGNAAPCDSDAYYGSCGGKKASSTIGPIKYNNDIGCAMCLADALGMDGCSTDDFAIRPDQFDNNLTPGQVLIADNNTSISFHANRYGGVGTLDYDESETQTTPSFVIDANISDPTKNCEQPSMNFTPRITFADGNVTGNFSLPNIGDLNVTMHEIVGAEYALVDADDTNTSLRLITPYAQQIQVIPHHFGVAGGLTNGSNGFTYLSNFEQNPNDADRNISASLDINVTAQAENNATTSNYTSTCYAKGGNVTLVLADPITPNPTGSLTKLIWYHYTPDSNGSVDINTTVSQYNIPFLSTQFDSNDTNGTAEFSYKINFDRNVTKVVNPFMVVVTDINATDTDSVNGTNPVDSNATFVYGRVIARDVRIFGQKPFRANAWYEAFSQTPLSIGGTALAPSRTDTNWYIMAPHSDAQDGDANVTHIISTSNTTLPIGSTATAGVEIYNFAAETPPYSAKAHINTEAWLWYGINALDYADPSGANLDCFTHPCFNINVVPAVGATGSATSNELKSDKKNKATSTNPSGVTYDYSPAIR